jgi:predicted Zn-dependent protease
MQPLTPKDLIIRTQSEAQQTAQKSNSATVISFERFQELERVIRDTPIDIAPYIELADIYFKANRWTDARRILEIAVNRFPDDPHAVHLLEEAQMARSLELLNKVESEHRAEPTQLTQQNIERCQVEFNVLRERVFRQRLARNPEQLELTIPLAEALDRLDNQTEAIELLKRASQEPTLRAQASLQLGRLLERAQRIPEALSAYRRAAFFRVPPPPAEIKYAALFAAADLALKSGLIDSGRRYLEMLIEHAPEQVALKQRLDELRDLPL